MSTPEKNKDMEEAVKKVNENPNRLWAEKGPAPYP